MRPSQIARVLTSMLRAGDCPPVMVSGPPGCGKSMIVKQVAEGLGVDLIDLRVVLLDPVDLRGLPKIGAKEVKWVPPSFLPKSGKGILFLDELPNAPPLVQSSCLQLALDRSIGEYVLPECWHVVAAGNRQEDRAGTHRMISSLLNRFVHLDFEVSSEDWQLWASANKVRAEIRGFLRWKPDLLFSFDPSKSEKAFPTPRSWGFLSRAMDAVPERELLMALASGTVGVGAAGEFVSYLRVYAELPDLDFVIANPESCPVPSEPSVCYALVQAIIDRGKAEKTTSDEVGRMLRFVERMSSEEYGVLVARELYASERHRGNRQVVEYMKRHKNLMGY